jgi:DNA-binding beta-propeller fold protein YncE
MSFCADRSDRVALSTEDRFRPAREPRCFRSARPLAVIVLLSLALASAAAANPRELYAVTGAQNTPSTLYVLDATNGSVRRTIGPVGFSHVTGLAFHPVTGELYGIISAAGGSLIKINPLTGAGVIVGPHGFPAGTPDLSFAPSGLLYTWTESVSGDFLAKVNVATGAGTIVGNCGVSTSHTGLAIDRDGTAFMKNALNVYTVNRVTGACTLLSPVSGASLDNMLAIDDRGTMFSAARTATGADLYTLDPLTGVATKIGSNALTELSALAFEPPPLEELYAVDGAGNNPATLYRLDPRNGSVLATIGSVGFVHAVGLAFHPVTGLLYATANDPGTTVFTINPATAATAVIGSHGLQIPDIAFAPSGVLYGWNELSSADQLVRIDLGTGAATTVGSCGVSTAKTGLGVDASGQAWMKPATMLYRVDRASGACSGGIPLVGAADLDDVLAVNGRNTLYTADRQSGVTELYTIDPVTGDAIPVGTNAIANLAALAFRPLALPRLYGADGAGGNPSTLYRLDPRNGSVLETVGPIGFNEVVGLAFHPVTNTLYGVSNSGSGQLLKISVSNGAGTPVGGPIGSTTQIPDLAFAPSGQLYGWDEPNNHNLLKIDLTTGAPTTVGTCGFVTHQTGLGIDFTGLVRMKAGIDLYPVNRLTGVCGPPISLAAGTLHNALAYAPGGILYSLERQTTGVTELFTIDPETGDVNPVGSNPIAHLAALAFVPEPSKYGMLLAGIAALVVLAGWRHRRVSRC